MDYSKIVYTLEFDDEFAGAITNQFLKKGWLLLSVGPKTIDSIGEYDKPYYSTAYVVGATEEKYQEYLREKNRFLNTVLFP